MTPNETLGPAWYRELRQLSKTAVPIVVTQVGSMSLGVVDTMMVGHVGVEEMAAAALATQWAALTLTFGTGLVMGIDPIISQAHGAQEGYGVARGLQRGLVLAGLVSLLIAVTWLGLEPFLLAWGQPPSLAQAAGDYLRVQLPSAPFAMLSVALRSYLQGQNLTRPGLVVVLAANVTNALLNWGLIFGFGAFEGLGLWGAGLATTVTRVGMALMLWGWIWGFGLHRDHWVPFDRSLLRFRSIRQTLSLGLPVGLSFLTEVLAFSGSTFLAARLGSVSTSAHTIVLNVAALVFMVPLGFGMAAAARVGQLSGRRDYDGVQRTVYVVLASNAALMLSVGAGLFALREAIPRLYTESSSVIELAVTSLPIVAAFQLADGTQVVAGGLLRGMARTRIPMLGNLIGYYVIGLPFGAWLAFSHGMGVPGIWWGLLAGLSCVAALLSYWVYRVRRRPILAAARAA